MRNFFLFLLPLIISADSYVAFEKKCSSESKKAMENEKVKCRWVCDKRIYKEQRIAEAIEFYKKTRDYNNTVSD